MGDSGEERRLKWEIVGKKGERMGDSGEERGLKWEIQCSGKERRLKWEIVGITMP